MNASLDPVSLTHAFNRSIQNVPVFEAAARLPPSAPSHLRSKSGRIRNQDLCRRRSPEQLLERIVFSSFFWLNDGLFTVPPPCRSDARGTIRSRIVEACAQVWVCSASGLRSRFDELLRTDPQGEDHRSATLSGQIAKSISTNCRGQSHWSSDRDEQPLRSCVYRSLTWVAELESLGPWSGYDLVAELCTSLNLLFGDIVVVSERRSTLADLGF
ncbi:hypothetical protein U1Q18_026028 [Sarracenia purpurea var. burkii]